jgi:hypothetical protein
VHACHTRPRAQREQFGVQAKDLADHALRQRRKAEDARTMMVQSVNADFVVGAAAHWEQRSDAKLKERAVQRRYDSIRAQDKAALAVRRQRLANMLLGEEASFQQEIDALDETPEQRRVRMETRARELRNKREAERKTFVDEQLERQWRLGCDALRNADSVNIAKSCEAARAYQIEERLALLNLEQQEEQIFSDQWLADWAAKERRELEEEAYRKKMDDEQTKILGRQVGEKAVILGTERAEKAAIAAEMARQWQADKDATERAEVEKRRRQYAAKLELDAFNASKRNNRVNAYQKELTEDQQRLQMIMAKEAEDARIEREHLATQHREALAYQKHLQILMAKEAKDEADLEKARDADLGGRARTAREARGREPPVTRARVSARGSCDAHPRRRRAARSHARARARGRARAGKAWDKRVAQWGREQAAREQLLQATLEGRKVQVRGLCACLCVRERETTRARTRASGTAIAR